MNSLVLKIDGYIHFLVAMFLLIYAGRCIFMKTKKGVGKILAWILFLIGLLMLPFSIMKIKSKTPKAGCGCNKGSSYQQTYTYGPTGQYYSFW